MHYLSNLYLSKYKCYFSSKRTEIDKLLPKNRDKVLEIGCGSGATLHWLKQEKGSSWVAGVKLTEDASARARVR